MSSIITDVRVITPDHWMKENDGKYYTHIPFQCDENEDTLIEFVDSDEYIQQHKEDFDALNSGYTQKNVCIISADHKPSCNMSIQIKRAAEEDGRVMYSMDKDGHFTAEWVPNNKPDSLAALFGAFSGAGINPNEVDTNQVLDMIDREEKKKEIIL